MNIKYKTGHAAQWWSLIPIQQRGGKGGGEMRRGKVQEGEEEGEEEEEEEKRVGVCLCRLTLRAHPLWWRTSVTPTLLLQEGTRR